MNERTWVRDVVDAAPELPAYVQIEPVGQCNLRCQMCPILFRRDGPPHGPPAFMEFEQFRRLIGQFPGLRDLHLQGLGEPMMHPRFFDMAAYAAGRGIRVTTNTNLTLLNRRRARLLVESGLDCIHVSVDGATAATFERIRRRARFGVLLGNLRLLAETKRQWESRLPRLHVVMVVMRQNLHELPAVVQLAAGFGAEEVFVQHLCHDFGESGLPPEYVPMRDFVESQTLLAEDPERVERHFQEARETAARENVRLRLPQTRLRLHPPGTPGRERCDWPWKGAYFSYQGYAMPCCMVSTPDRIHFGNAFDQGVKAVWNGAAYRDFRERLGSEEPPEICRSCSLYRGTF
ncbi:MAG: radical SAM protein [Bryobacterales bacterium]|nr:radical SAM protein [Bryobacterales bacterium]